MKRLQLLSTMVLAGLFMTTNVFAGHRSFKGKWKCTVSGYEMELAPTSYGFKSRNLKTNVWQNYDEIYYNHFADQAGNTFDWRDDAWHYASDNGSKNMTFRPFDRGPSPYHVNYDRYDDYDNGGYNDRYDDYDDRHYNYGKSGLIGSWYSTYGRSSMFIKSSGRKCIIVDKDNRNRWRDFRRTRRGVYKDKRGNKIKNVGRNQIEWTSHCGRYHEVYTRGRGYNNRDRYNRGSRNNRGGYGSCSG